MLLLRADDSLHSELSVRGRESGMSIDALATELLSLGVGATGISRTHRLRARLQLAGEIGPGSIPCLAAGESLPGHRQRANESMVGALIDDILAPERSR